MGGGSAPKPDTAITLSISKLAALLGVKQALLKNILGTTQIELRDQPKIIAGGIDNELDMGFWTFFNPIGSIPVINIPREAAMHHLNRECTNDAVNAGNHSILIEPAANSILIIYFAAITNNDTVDRVGFIAVNTAGGTRVSLLSYDATVTVAGQVVFPFSNSENRIAADPDFKFTDAYELLLQLSALAVSENTSFFISYSYVGTAPTITETGPAGSAFADVA